jgi:long-chain fatty acid transport protein
MKRMNVALAALMMTTGLAHAGGIDRSGQDIGILFETGRVGELSFGSVMPDVSGVDVLGNKIGNVGADYMPFSLGYKADISDTLSYALIIDQPFGADVTYGGSPASTMLGGTRALAKASALTGLLRYKLNEGVSVYGGPRIEQSSAHVDLRGLAYGGFNGYSVDLDSNTAVGYAVGAAFEKPEIALRVALTYNSAISHDFDTVETISGFTVGTKSTEVETPQSVNLDVQSGVAANTLVFGQIRWVDWSGFRLDPAFFVSKSPDGTGLIALKDTTTLTIGVGHKFNDTWSGALSMTYEKAGNKLVSPLAPTTGQMGATLAAVYTVGNIKVTAGVNYTQLGDADPATAKTARAHFTDNSALGVGIKLAVTF